MSQLIVATVGTDHHPFDRVVGWVDRWFRDCAPSGARCIVQHGTAFAPEYAEGHAYIPGDELNDMMSEAAAVVSHGGPSTIMEIRAAGLLPLVIPRDPSLGEHVDEHQMIFARHLVRHDRVERIGDEPALQMALDHAFLDPEIYRIDTSAEGKADLAEFSRLIDGLLGVTEPNPIQRAMKKFRSAAPDAA